MSTKIALCLLFFVTATAKGQLTEFNFIYQSISPTCNPFKDQADNFRHDSKWKVSHGTPEVEDYYDNLFFNVAKLNAEKSSTGVAKSEGLYIAYDFKCTNSYDITIAARQGSGDATGFNIIGKKSITPVSNTNCGLDATTVHDNYIYNMFPAYNGSFGDFNGITISNWRPDTDLAYVLIESFQPYINKAGSCLF